MLSTRAYAAKSSTSGFSPFTINRRDPGADDIIIDILYCGLCHSDIHTVRDEWSGTTYPVVPGHEILGRVSQVGKKVKRFKVGDVAGVGCFVDSCRTCPDCKKGEEQFCKKLVFTYNMENPKEGQQTYGGYSERITIDQRYAFKINSKQPLERVAPLLCAGITTYSPLKHAKLKKGAKVGIVGLGGLGHVAVKIAKAMGFDVTVFSTSDSKKADAKKLGAKSFVNTKADGAFAPLTGTFDYILDTVSAKHDLHPYLGALKHDGTMTLLGAPQKPHELNAFMLLMGRKTLGGSLIGGTKETQEMLDFCYKHKVLADVEVIAPQQLDQAYDRTVASDVKYRFVVDLKKLSVALMAFLISSSLWAFDSKTTLSCQSKGGKPVIVEIFDNLSNGVPAVPDVFSIVTRPDHTAIVLPQGAFEAVSSSDKEWTFSDLKNKVRYENCRQKDFIGISSPGK